MMMCERSHDFLLMCVCVSELCERGENERERESEKHNRKKEAEDYLR
jgi:hypothetical protein